MIDLEDYRRGSDFNDTAEIVNPGYKDALNNWLYCAQMSAKNKDYSAAAYSYSGLIKYQPDSIRLYINLADAYENLNHVDSVINLMNRLLRKVPKCVPALSKLGEMYGKHLKDLKTSMDYLMKAYAISPTDASLLVNIGVAYGIQNKFDKSIELFNKALAVILKILKLI